MKTKSSIEKVIEEMVAATYGSNLAAREKYFLRESLRNLVRLAKAEQMLEIQANVRKLTGIATRRRVKAELSLKRGRLSGSAQRHFEFNQNG